MTRKTFRFRSAFSAPALLLSLFAVPVQASPEQATVRPISTQTVQKKVNKVNIDRKEADLYDVLKKRFLTARIHFAPVPSFYKETLLAPLKILPFHTALNAVQRTADPSSPQYVESNFLRSEAKQAELNERVEPTKFITFPNYDLKTTATAIEEKLNALPPAARAIISEITYTPQTDNSLLVTYKDEANLLYFVKWYGR